MSKTVRINPITRIEGHLEVEVTVESVDGVDQVIDAKAGSPMFRGFELILKGRHPRDATHFTQRVCGVCPVSHGMASTMALEDAFGVTPTPNGRTIRNLALGANYVQSHILHFYHLTALDYISTEGVVDMSPWKPAYSAPDLVTGATAEVLVGHYVQALEMRRKAHQLGAIFAGRQPCTTSFVPGGATQRIDAENTGAFRALLGEIRGFVDDVYIPDVEAVAGVFPAYSSIGGGCGNLLSYGVFDLDGDGTSRLLHRGRLTDGVLGDVDQEQIREFVAHSWYNTSTSDRNPQNGITEPSPGKDGAYSWLKAPRYEGAVHEVGPLARMWVTGDYRVGISVIDRLAARALETRKVAEAMSGWVDELDLDAPVYEHHDTPEEAIGVGLTEAPRGALGHWLGIESQQIDHYQMITPTGWNASPRDDAGQLGAIEQALLGTPVRDVNEPLEVLRVVHSFDPCVACSVHLLRPGERKPRVTVKTSGAIL